MPTPQPLSPFDDQFIEEYQLANAPLARVVSQIRHPPLTRLVGPGGEETALRIASQLAEEYPIIEQAQNTEVVLGSEGVQQRPGKGFTWRLESADRNWRVSFARDFLSIDTSMYQGRSDFCERLDRVVQVYKDTVQPPAITRIGYRYTNLISDDGTIANLASLIRAEVLGVLAIELPRSVRLGHSLSQSEYKFADGGLIVNSGWAPAGAMLDNSPVPLDAASWLLDLDAFTSLPLDFDPTKIGSAVRELGLRAYRYFAWAVTQEFVKRFGGPQ